MMTTSPMAAMPPQNARTTPDAVRIPADATSVLIERVWLDGGRQGGSRTRKKRVKPDLLAGRLRRLADGRYRLSAYGPGGIVPGGVCVVEVVAGVVTAASPRTTRDARVRARGRRAPRPVERESASNAVIAALTQRVAELTQIVAAQGGTIAGLTALVRKGARPRKKRAAATPSPMPQAPPASATPPPPRTAVEFTPRPIDLRGIAFPQQRAVIANPAAPPVPRGEVPARVQPFALEAFLRQVPAPRASNDAPPPASTTGWADFTALLRFLCSMGEVPGVTSTVAPGARAPGATLGGVLRRYTTPAAAPTSPPDPQPEAANDTREAASETKDASPAPVAPDAASMESETAAAPEPPEALFEVEETPAADALGDVIAAPDEAADADGEPHAQGVSPAGETGPTVPRAWIDRSASNEFVRIPAVLVPRRVYQRLERRVRSLSTTMEAPAIESVYAVALTLGLESLGEELSLDANDEGTAEHRPDTPSRAPARAFERLRSVYVPAPIARALRDVVQVAMSVCPRRYPNATVVHAEALRRGVELLEHYPDLLDDAPSADERGPAGLNPIVVADAIGAQLGCECRGEAC